MFSKISRLKTALKRLSRKIRKFCSSSLSTTPANNTVSLELSKTTVTYLSQIGLLLTNFSVISRSNGYSSRTSSTPNSPNYQLMTLTENSLNVLMVLNYHGKLSKPPSRSTKKTRPTFPYSRNSKN